LRKGDGPDALSVTIGALIDEVDAAFAQDRWALLQTRTPAGSPHVSEAAIVRLHAGAGLRHCCALLSDINLARTEGRENLARLGARAHLESWLVAMYVHLGGIGALQAIDGSYQQELQRWNRSIVTYNSELKTERRKAAKKRRAVTKSNEDRLKHNELYPDREPLPLLPLPAPPTAALNEIDVTPALADITHGEARSLPLMEMIKHINRLLRDRGEPDPELQTVYDSAYRFLSMFGGAHTTLRVLDSYIIGRDRLFLRLAKEQTSSPMAWTLTNHAAMFTAHLAQWVLGSEDQPTPVADAFLEQLVANAKAECP
jgi:hypothetical protein